MIGGYLRTMRQYLATPKGAFDARDYLKAAGLMLLSMAALALVVEPWKASVSWAARLTPSTRATC